MRVVASIDQPLIFAGDPVKLHITFTPQSSNTDGSGVMDAVGLAVLPRSPVPSEPGSPKSVPGSSTPSGFNSDSEGAETSPALLLSGYAAVQGSFKLGDMLNATEFTDARKKGVVMGHHGFEYGRSPTSQGQGLLAGVLGGLKQLIVHDTNGAGADDVDEGDYPIYTSAQALLFTDLLVDRPHTFELVVDLPPELPPSYRSRSLQVSYHLVVGFQTLSKRRSSSVASFRSSNGFSGPLPTRLFLPFRVYSRPSPQPELFDLRSPIVADSPHPVDYKDGCMEEFVQELLSNPEHRRTSTAPSIGVSGQVSFDIAKAGVSIANLILSRPAVRVGDMINCTLDLQRPCLHISAYLELGEKVVAPYTTAEEDETYYQTFVRQTLGCYALDQVSLQIPTLTSITPRLDTAQVTANWSLRIDFVGLVGTAFADKDDDELEGMVAKGQVECELFSCRIPISILPPDVGGSGPTKVWAIHHL